MWTNLLYSLRTGRGLWLDDTLTKDRAPVKAQSPGHSRLLCSTPT